MYLYAVAGSKTAKIMALFTLLAVIISLLPASAFAEEVPAEPEIPADTQVADPADTATDTPDAVEQAIETPSLLAKESSREACEIEGHKYDATGNPLSGWAIGLMKVITFADEDTQTSDLDEDTTDEDGYYCLEWDGYTNTEVIEEPHSFSYRVYEILKAGWNYLSVEEGPDADNLNVVADEDILVEDGRVSVQIGEENGYIYANAEHHVDFYNKEIDPCDEDVSVSTKSISNDEDPCDNDGDDSDIIDGYKFNDKNGNGIWDSETENGIEGWEIMLTEGDSDPRYTTTDEDGYYSFEVEDGSYVVSETQQKGWEQTATIGENVDGDRCYINVGEVMAAKTAIVDDEIAVDYNDTCIFGNKEIIVAPVCETGNNLLVNGSFEDPEVDGDWSIFSTVAGWTIALSDGLELWANGFYGGASEGNQNAELDGNAPTKITQNVTTVPGATYELRFDFSARPDADSAADNNVDGLVNGAAIMNATANGSDIVENTWSTHSQAFVASGTSTEIGFVDKGTANSYGSLIDNAVVCLVSTPNGGGDGDTPTRRGGGGSGTRVKRAPAGEVLGASVSTPTGQVLGDATSTLPVGAPNTGAGGTAQVVVQLPTIVAVLPKSAKIK